MASIGLESSEVGKLLLPKGIPVAQFVDWLDRTFKEHFPTTRTPNRHLFSLYYDFYDFETIRTEPVRTIGIFKVTALGFNQLINPDPQSRTEVAQIEIDVVGEKVQLHFFFEEAKDLGLIQRLFIRVHNKWPNSEIINGKWILKRVKEQGEAKASKPKLGDDSLVEWSEEPTTKNRYDWFKHRLWCDKNGVRKKKHSQMGKICGLEEQSFKNAYHEWKKQEGNSWYEIVRNSTFDEK